MLFKLIVVLIWCSRGFPITRSRRLFLALFLVESRDKHTTAKRKSHSTNFVCVPVNTDFGDMGNLPSPVRQREGKERPNESGSNQDQRSNGQTRGVGVLMLFVAAQHEGA